MFNDGVKHWLAHRNDAAWILSDVESLDVKLQRNWSDIRMDIEETCCAAS